MALYIKKKKKIWSYIDGLIYIPTKKYYYCKNRYAQRIFTLYGSYTQNFRSSEEKIKIILLLYTKSNLGWFKD